MSQRESTPARVRWARLRFSIIGRVLASPPESGELGQQLDELAARAYVHPATGERVHFGRSTIERWLYAARNAADPIVALERKLHARAGMHPSIGLKLAEAIRAQYRAHPRWSYQLHHDNLRAQARTEPSLGRVPSRITLTRYMKSQGLVRSRSKKNASQIAHGLLPRETRSYEVTHVGGLWHTDFHAGSRRVAWPDGEWMEVRLLGVLDDHSRLGCHLQWYPGRGETPESSCHGLSQALQKRGLPRGLMSDGGGAFVAAEMVEGLARLGIVHHQTLPHSPEQNGKKENFWAQVEGRLMAMLEGEKQLTLELLNRATLAWLECEYNRKLHSEIGTSPLERWLAGPNVMRPCPSSDALRRAFRRQETRTQRRSDGTLTVGGVRYEIPTRYRTLLRPTVRWASWDLSSVDLVDERTAVVLATLQPLDKEANADGKRRVLAVEPDMGPEPAPSGIAPLLRELMTEYAATGLPPAYVPLLPRGDDEETDP
ncbi:MAG: IS481 family transposase [Polyangiaceae bacterium]